MLTGHVARPRPAAARPRMERRSAPRQGRFLPLTEWALPPQERLSMGFPRGQKPMRDPGRTRPAWPVFRSDNVRRELLRRLPCPPTAVLPPAGPRLRPGGRWRPCDLCPAALRRRRAPEKGCWRGLTRVPARMLPYPLPAPRPETARPRATAGEKARSGPRGAVSADVKSAVREDRADKLRPRAGLLPHVPAYERKHCKFNLCKVKLHNMNFARSQTKFDEKTCMKREYTLHRRN